MRTTAATTQHLLALGGRLVRSNLRLALEGRAAACRLDGLFLADGDRQVDLHTQVSHVGLATETVQDYRGIAAGRGRGGFNGKIVVQSSARGANASQSSRNLLLTPLAEINARPQLEIEVDEVQCRHGATTGTLDPEQLFYLVSRGLDPAAARALLTFAFCLDVTGRLPIASVRAAAETLVFGRAAGSRSDPGNRLMAAVRETAVALDLARIRSDFPVLARRVNGHPLAYLDNAASSQQPSPVIDAVAEYARSHHANVHRGVHTLSQEATALFEGAREKVQRFINAASPAEIVFVRGTTEAINLVAQSYGRPRLVPGDEIVVSHLEHHSNIVPWQLLCEQTGAKLRVVPIDRSGVVDFDAYLALLAPKTRIVALAHVSNALGTVLPLDRFIAEARQRGIVSVIDGAQAVPHLPVDVQALGSDFYAFSAHKMYGPTGIGVLHARESLLAAMPPWQGGGDMILSVSFAGSTWNHLPHRFEAGTPNIGGAVGLGAAIDYMGRIGHERIAAHEQDLLDYATARLSEIEGLALIGTAPVKCSLVSFAVEGIHPHDLGTVLDSRGVAVRTGHHCAMPVMEFFGVPATTRASFALYNTRDEVDALHDALLYAIRMLR